MIQVSASILVFALLSGSPSVLAAEATANPSAPEPQLSQQAVESESASVLVSHPSSAPLSFSVWRDQHIAEAKNQVVRRSNRLQLAANGKLSKASLQEFDFAREERALAEAIETLQHAEERSREDYFEIYLDIYLSEFKSDLGFLQSLMQSISTEEAGELVHHLLVRGQLPSRPSEGALKSSAHLSP